MPWASSMSLKASKIINGHYTKDLTIEDPTGKAPKEVNLKGELVPTFGKLMADGSTSSGNWLMSGSFEQKGANKMMKRGKEDPTGLGLFADWCLCLAAQPAHHLQPRLLRSERQTLQSEDEASGVDRRQMGRRCCRRSLAADSATRKRANTPLS